MIEGVKLIEKVKETLSLQEAKVIIVMRELPYQTITIKMEEGKVIHKEQVKSIKDYLTPIKALGGEFWEKSRARFFYCNG
ncbi:MAG: hypothetical protein MUO61_03380 [Dehalococcoidia bacterium]|nr:hypothetical protein [Dehalococcoidia bacterium]